MKKFNKKGFTLIEIIIAITLIATISVSSIVGVRYAIKKNTTKKQNEVYSKFDVALDTYLSSHHEVYENLENNTDGAIITLELLKNEGLISDNIIDPATEETIDYANRFYLLSDAKLLSESEAKKSSNKDCGDQVAITVIKNWEVLNDTIDKDSVIYICPKETSANSVNSDNGIDELERRISALEQNANLSKFVYTGENPNNYVYFDVDDARDKNSLAYWPSKNKNLWRIYSYYGTTSTANNIKLIYNQPVEINSNYRYPDLEKLSSSYTIYLYDETKKERTDTKVTYSDSAYNTNCKVTIDGKNKNIYMIDGEYYIYQTMSKKKKWYAVTPYETTESIYHKDSSFVCTDSKSVFYYSSSMLQALDENENYPNNTIKGDIFNNIKYKDWIQTYPYYFNYEGSNRYNATITYSTVNYQKIGVITTKEFKATIENSKTWLSYYTNSLVGQLHYYFEDYYVYPSIDQEVDTVDMSDGANHDFTPVIVLENGVKIVSDESCGTPGTKTCPYKLSFEGETTNSN